MKSVEPTRVQRSSSSEGGVPAPKGRLNFFKIFCEAKLRYYSLRGKTRVKFRKIPEKGKQQTTS